MKKTIKYIILMLLLFAGIYNLIRFQGQGSMMPLYFALESFCLFGVLALHEEKSVCRK